MLEEIYAEGLVAHSKLEELRKAAMKCHGDERIWTASYLANDSENDHGMSILKHQIAEKLLENLSLDVRKARKDTETIQLMAQLTHTIRRCKASEIEEIRMMGWRLQKTIAIEDAVVAEEIDRVR